MTNVAGGRGGANFILFTASLHMQFNSFKSELGSCFCSCLIAKCLSGVENNNIVLYNEVLLCSLQSTNLSELLNISLIKPDLA